MDEEETVLSSWKRSDFETEKVENGEPDNVVLKDNLDKEKADLKARRFEKDSRKTEFSREFGIEESQDVVTLEDDVLSRFIEEDARKITQFGCSDPSLLISPRPKPKPRHRERSPEYQRKNSATDLFSGKKENSQKYERKNSADKPFSGSNDNSRRNSAAKLFSGKKDESPHRERKNSATKLFSGNKENLPEEKKTDSAANLFSGKKEKETKGDKTSPRPVPRPRPKQISKESSAESKNNSTKKSLSSLEKTDKFSDLTGKESRFGTSFDDFINPGKMSSNINQEYSKSLDNEKPNIKLKQSSDGNKQIPPPTKPRRTKLQLGVKTEQSSDGSLEHRQPKPRYPREQFEQQNIVGPQENYEQPAEKSHRINEGRQDLITGYNEDSGFQLHNKSPYVREQDRENGLWERRDVRKDGIKTSENDLKDLKRQEQIEYDRINHSQMVKNKNNIGHSHEKRGYAKDGSEMFKEHVPNIEGVLHQHNDDNDHHERRTEGTVRRNTPMKAERRLEEMTKSPDLYNFQYESRDIPHRPQQSPRGSEKFGMKRSSSLNTLNYSSRSVHFKEDEHEPDAGWDSSRSDFPSSKHIRETVYNEWLQRKQHNLKEKSKKKKEEKKEEEEKEKEKLEKQMSAKKAFEVWSSQKEEVIKKQVKKKKELENKKIDEKREKIGKQKDAKKFFESWKSKKDELLKESVMEKKEKEKEAKKKEKGDMKEKTVIAKKSYEKWKQRKDEQIKVEIKNKKKEELVKTKYEVEVEMDKQYENEKAYQEFLRKKGTTKRRPPSPSLTQRAWCPGGLTKGTNFIPENVQPVIAPPKMNRSRSFSGTRTMTLRGGH